MSERAETLTGERLEAETIISKLAARGMISVRGNLKSEKMISAIKQVTGVDIPEPGYTHLVDGQGCVWMSPDEVLVLVNKEDVASKIATVQAILKGEHSMLVDVSDARVVFEIKGNFIREVLAKLCPADMSQQAFVPGQVRRTRIAQVAGAFWMLDGETIELICFRSSADYVFGLLKQSAKKGAELQYF